MIIDDLEIEVTRKRMKSVRLRVLPSGAVKVSAPFSTSDARIESFVRARLDWIREQRAALAAFPQARAEQASSQEIAEWREVVEACVPPLVRAWEPVLGVRVEKLVYRNMRSRWGSCQPATGRVCINTRLALYPPECLEYVVVHELCHFLVQDHGPRFKDLMSRVMPDWKERERKLR